ncbi:Arginine deiminase [Pseudomonas fluorescens]|uniref:arginine deiminase n=1 Tax=Pseudomonas fluorescens TaxID=294 RepID=A0A5E6ZZF3_PSEFL|nr:Arginine deiminase [Pseudomonas fluorescens]
MPKLKLGVHSEAGKLHKVMVCSPGLAHQRLTPDNCNDLLFDDVLWVAQGRRDHFDFVARMRERSIDVLEVHNLLTDFVCSSDALDWILQRKITANLEVVQFTTIVNLTAPVTALRAMPGAPTKKPAQGGLSE